MKLFRSYSLILLSLVALCAATVSAQEPQVAKTTIETGELRSETVSTSSITTPPAVETRGVSSALDLTRTGVQTAQPIPLTLNDAIRRALEGNNDIAISRDDVRFQETILRSLLGFYDPVFTATPTYTRNSTTGSAATNDFRVNADVTHFIRPGGGNYQVFFNNTRTENAFAQAQVSSGSIVSAGNAAIYSSSLGFRYTQPLFRNFKTDNRRQLIKIARKRLQQTDADFRTRTIDIISQVQRAYWDLVFNLRNQQNQVANVNLARENLRQIEARIEAGASAPLDRAEVATELANREGELLLATQQVSITENLLKQLLLKEPTSTEWTQTYVPTDKPIFSLDPLSLDDAMKDAMDNRFELRRLRLQKEINTIDIEYFKNQSKPQIDFVSIFSLDGLSRGNGLTQSTLVPIIAGDPATDPNAFLLQQIIRFHPNVDPVPNVLIPATPSFLVGGFNRSLSNIFRSDAPNFSVGVTISFPFRNRRAKAELAGARVQDEQIASQTRAQEQVVIVEVRNSVQAVETARQRVLTARRARENAEIQLDGERKKYESGLSTTFLLFQRENTLTNARNAEIRAETDYNKALANLQQATSTTFRTNNIEVESPTDENN